MKFSLSIFIALTIVLIGCGETPKIDLIVHNAKIYTVNESFDVVEAIAIDKGKIIAVGAENEIKNKYFLEDISAPLQQKQYFSSNSSFDKLRDDVLNKR